MPIDVNPIDIVQIDATIIVGVLILLTLTKFAKQIGEDMPKSVLWIVVPFSLSAAIALLSLLFEFPEFAIWLSVLLTVIGFVLIMVTVRDFTIKPTKKPKS